MKSRDFCYWLKGFFELSFPNMQEAAFTMTPEQVLAINRHLNMVFKHEIDPSNGTLEHNKELGKIHDGKTESSTIGHLLSGKFDPGSTMNC